MSLKFHDVFVSNDKLEIIIFVLFIWKELLNSATENIEQALAPPRFSSIEEVQFGTMEQISRGIESVQFHFSLRKCFINIMWIPEISRESTNPQDEIARTSARELDIYVRRISKRKQSGSGSNGSWPRLLSSAEGSQRSRSGASSTVSPMAKRPSALMRRGYSSHYFLARYRYSISNFNSFKFGRITLCWVEIASRDCEACRLFSSLL